MRPHHFGASSITPAELKELILSDYFTGAAGDYLLKIDSKIYYKTKPDQRLSSTSNTQASTSDFTRKTSAVKRI